METESPKIDHEIDPQRAIEHVRNNRQKAKEFADKIRQGYIPEKRLKDEIVEHIYDSMTGSHDKPSYDDLLELRNYLIDGNGNADSGQTQDRTDKESVSDDALKPEKSEAVLVDESKARVKKNNNQKQSIANNDPEEIKEVEGKDYYVWEFKKPLGSVSFNKDRTCTDSNGNIIGMWNEEGRIRDPEGKQIGHLPSGEADRFNAFLEALGLRDQQDGLWNGLFHFHW